MKAAWFALLAPVMLLGQMPPIGTIEIYGLHKVSSREVLRAIGVKEGDPPPASESEGEARQERVGRVAGVVRARLSMGCCTAGKSSLFVGIEEKGAPRLEFRSAPQSNISLTESRPPDVLSEIRKRALPSPGEMVHWKEYDRFSYALLGRMAGLTEKEIETPASPQQREKVIARATNWNPKGDSAP